mgnify:CR=1 FL=1
MIAKVKPKTIIKPAGIVIAKPIVIPTVATLEGSDISELKWLLYGPPGIGKSSFFAKAKKTVKGVLKQPWFLHTDPGLRFIKALKTPILAWKTFKKIVKEVTERPPKHVSMLVLDTADLLFRMCRKEVCQARGLEHISDAEWGKGYDMVRDEFEQEVAKLALLDQHGIGLAFISHSKDVDIRGRTVKTNKLVPTLPKQAHDLIAPLCDVIGYAGFSIERADRTPEGEMGRIVQFEPDETVEAKDRTGLLPAKCRLDFDMVKEALEGKAPSEEEGGGEEEEG